MERASKIWLGIFTFLPLVLLAVYLVFFAFLVKDILLYGDDIALMGDVGVALLLMLGIGIIGFGLFVYYIIHVINAKSDGNEKLLWLLLFFVANIFAFPVYFYLRIWKADTPDELSLSIH